MIDTQLTRYGLPGIMRWIYLINLTLDSSTDLKNDYRALKRFFEKNNDYFLHNQTFHQVTARIRENHRIYRSDTEISHEIMKEIIVDNYNPRLVQQFFESIEGQYPTELSKFDFDDFNSVTLKELGRIKYKETQWYIEDSNTDMYHQLSSYLTPWVSLEKHHGVLRGKKMNLNMEDLVPKDVKKNYYYPFMKNKPKNYPKKFLLNLAYLFAFDFKRMEDLMNRNGYTVRYGSNIIDQIIPICYHCGISFNNLCRIVDVMNQGENKMYF